MQKGLLGLKAHLADTYFIVGQWDDAGHLFEEILKDTNEDLALSVQAQAQAGLGRLARNRAAYGDALSWLQKAQTSYEALQDQVGLSRVLGELGSVFWRQAKYEAAIECYTQSLRIAEEISDRNQEAINIGSIGSVYLEQCEYARALHYFSQSCAIFEEVGHRSGVGKVTGNMGIAHARVGQLSAGNGLFPATVAHRSRVRRFPRSDQSTQFYGDALSDARRV